MGADYEACAIYGVTVTEDDFLVDVEKVLCGHPEAKGNNFCPQCGRRKSERVITTKELRPGWDKWITVERGRVCTGDALYGNEEIGFYHCRLSDTYYVGCLWQSGSHRNQPKVRTIDVYFVQSRVQKLLDDLGITLEPELMLFIDGSW